MQIQLFFVILCSTVVVCSFFTELWTSDEMADLFFALGYLQNFLFSGIFLWKVVFFLFTVCNIGSNQSCCLLSNLIKSHFLKEQLQLTFFFSKITARNRPRKTIRCFSPEFFSKCFAVKNNLCCYCSKMSVS